MNKILLLLSTLILAPYSYAGKKPVTLSQCIKIAENKQAAVNSGLMQSILKSYLKVSGEFENAGIDKDKSQQRLLTSYMTDVVSDAITDVADTHCRNIVSLKMDKDAAETILMSELEKKLKIYLSSDEFRNSIEVIFGQNCEKPSDKKNARIINFKNEINAIVQDIDTADSNRTNRKSAPAASGADSAT